jgi:hypothetical protein
MSLRKINLNALGTFSGSQAKKEIGSLAYRLQRIKEEKDPKLVHAINQKGLK